MQKIIKAVLCILLLVLLGAYLSFFEVEAGTVAQGPNQQLLEPGLQWKWPWQKVTVLNTTHQAFSVTAPATTWLLIVHVQSPDDYFKNSDGHSVGDLVEQAWSRAMTTDAWGAVLTTANLMRDQAQVLQSLQQDPDLAKNGVSVDALILNGVDLSATDQAKIVQNMQGLSTQIAQNVLKEGETQAEQIRATAQANYLATQTQALSVAATVMGESQAAAVKLLAPLYQKNPALFKAYVEAKAKQLQNSHS